MSTLKFTALSHALQDVDTIFFGRITLMVVMGIFLLVGAVGVFLFHAVPEVKAGGRPRSMWSQHQQLNWLTTVCLFVPANCVKYCFALSLSLCVCLYLYCGVFVAFLMSYEKQFCDFLSSGTVCVTNDHMNTLSDRPFLTSKFKPEKYQLYRLFLYHNHAWTTINIQYTEYLYKYVNYIRMYCNIMLLRILCIRHHDSSSIHPCTYCGTNVRTQV